MAFAKVILHRLGPSLRDSKIRANVAHHLLHVHWADTTQCVRLNVLVQQFIRIQFRTVRRQPENPNLCSMLSQPSTHGPRFVYWVAVRNQKHLPPRLPRQSQEATQEIQEHPRGEALTENHEGQPTPIGDRGDHVASETLAGARRQRRFSKVAKKE
jgi:hypothetical protein